MQYWQVDRDWRIVGNLSDWHWEFHHMDSWVSITRKDGKERMLARFIMKHVKPTGIVPIGSH